MEILNNGHSPSADGLPIFPVAEPALDLAHGPPRYVPIDRRVLTLCAWAIVIGIASALIAQVLVHLIGLITNLAFYGRISFAEVSPAENQLGPWVVVVPIVGAVIVGIMARYGSQAIRGHGIPEAMEQILTNQSRIPPRITYLKPLSAAISIGTGGPFGAEGPIIATGSALGSLIGQMISTTAGERKTLLAAGAAAGMAATFGSPVSAVLLAVELLLFEFRPRSLIPVALAASTAAALRMAMVGVEPMFPMPALSPPGLTALAFYISLGIPLGVAAVVITRAVYAVEDAFEHLPVHWMWWPAIGAVAVGLVGYVAPNTLGVGYSNITGLVSNDMTVAAVAWLCAMKFISWSISLGSGTSGGTLAPLFTLGGALGLLLGAGAHAILPHWGIDLRIAALVGMAATFAGASRALLASAVFAFETTLQPLGLLPLLGGCATSYLVASLLMRNSIMTEKISRRGIRTPAEYVADPLDQVLVRSVLSPTLVVLQADDSLATVRSWIAAGGPGTRHQGFPVLSAGGVLLGVLTRRDLLNPAEPDERRVRDLIRIPPKFVYDDCTVREAADHMLNHGIGRLPVILRALPTQVVGMVTRSDVLSAFRRQLDEVKAAAPNVHLPRWVAPPCGTNGDESARGSGK